MTKIALILLVAGFRAWAGPVPKPLSPEQVARLSPVLKGTTAVIVGASRGIGRSLAFHLCQLGVRLELVGSNAQNLFELEADLTGVCPEQTWVRGTRADISVEGELARVYSGVFALGHPIDWIIHNAAALEDSLLRNMDEQAMSRLVDTNIKSVLSTAKFATGYFQYGARASDFPGNVTFVSSMAAHQPLVGEVPYGATKAFMNFIAEGMRAETVVRNRMSVSVVMPGPVDTEMLQKAKKQRPHAANSVSDFYFAVSVSPEQVSLKIIENLALAKRGRAKEWVFPSWREALFFNLGKISPSFCHRAIQKFFIEHNGGDLVEYKADSKD